MGCELQTNKGVIFLAIFPFTDVKKYLIFIPFKWECVHIVPLIYPYSPFLIDIDKIQSAKLCVKPFHKITGCLGLEGTFKSILLQTFFIFHSPSLLQAQTRSSCGVPPSRGGPWEFSNLIISSSPLP